MDRPTRSRAMLAFVLIASAAVFAVGVTVERSQLQDTHHDAVPAVRTRQSPAVRKRLPKARVKGRQAARRSARPPKAARRNRTRPLSRCSASTPNPPRWSCSWSVSPWRWRWRLADADAVVAPGDRRFRRRRGGDRAPLGTPLSRGRCVTATWGCRRFGGIPTVPAAPRFDCRSRGSARSLGGEWHRPVADGRDLAGCQRCPWLQERLEVCDVVGLDDEIRCVLRKRQPEAVDLDVLRPAVEQRG